MPKGGYRVFDLKGAEISSSGTVVRGIFDFIESTNSKPILLINMYLSGSYLGGFYTAFRLTGDAFQSPCTVSADGTRYAKLAVRSDDTVFILPSPDEVPSAQNALAEQDGPSASI